MEECSLYFFSVAFSFTTQADLPRVSTIHSVPAFPTTIIDEENVPQANLMEAIHHLRSLFPFSSSPVILVCLKLSKLNEHHI